MWPVQVPAINQLPPICSQLKLRYRLQIRREGDRVRGRWKFLNPTAGTFGKLLDLEFESAVEYVEQCPAVRSGEWSACLLNTLPYPESMIHRSLKEARIHRLLLEYSRFVLADIMGPRQNRNWFLLVMESFLQFCFCTVLLSESSR
ncbi:hypothetical protein CEXT_603571 [Caerostris extrusa]|uniref:Uncharacterized protein n=1 Tax=Caerostris extrusa TaxID=172846 RepID=A0AAV4PV89_CAEEX|nr:hypothetical protein CEXT_603571 [Caerostris extrusa]